MKQCSLIVAGLFAIPLLVMGQAFPVLPPAGYDQGGQYPAGQVQSISYFSTETGTNRTMQVYTPPGYTTAQEYSVIYAFHGIDSDGYSIMAPWGATANTVADNLIGQGKIRPVIIVAPDYADIEHDFGLLHREISNVIIPYMESNYSVRPGAEHRGIYGFSWGGGMAFREGLGNLDTYRYISPSSAAPSKPDDATLFPDGGVEAKELLKLLLISCGDADWLGLFGTSEATHNFCVANEIPHAWLPVKGGNHDGGSTWTPAMWNFLQMADAAGISDPMRIQSAYSKIEAEDRDGPYGGALRETCSEGGQDIGSIQNGYYAVYRNIDFGTGAINFQARVASATSGGNIEVRLDSLTGTLVGTCSVAGTAGWQTWTTRSCTVSGATGVHDVYLKFTGGSGYLFNVNWWQCTGPVSSVSIPSAPGSLAATPATEQAMLEWTASAGATSYNVNRATTSGGPYTTVANIPGTEYVDTEVIGGTTYYYTVSALNIGGEGANSAQTMVIPSVDVLSPWLAQDVGPVGLAGSADFTNGVFSLIGSGADIGASSDAFRFVHVDATGDCTIVARVASLEDHISSWSKAGVMIRESLDDDAKNVFIGVTPGNGAAWQFRSSAGGATSSSSTAGPSVPYWVKLVRSGNTFTGYVSLDGTSWSQTGSTTLAMASSVHVGLALTSHNDYTLCSATFDHVTAPGWAPVAVIAPTGLAARPGTEQVALSWAASAGATSYNVKRAASFGGPYTTIANVAGTNYTDTGVAGRTTYYYVVSALSNEAGESDDSALVSATPASSVPAPWLTQDIGTVGLAGSASVANGTFTINGSGDDVWNSEDAFRFVYVTKSGDFSIVTRVASVQYSDPWAKAGVMVRESLDANAVNAFVAVTPGNGVTWQTRSSAGGGTANVSAGGLAAPYWVKLVRSGDTFTGYRSANGTTWTQLGSATLTMSSSVYIGLAVTAHNNSQLCEATFDNVTAPGWPLTPLEATAVALSDIQIGLEWNAHDSATSYNVKRSTTSGGPYTTIATGIMSPAYTDTVSSVRDGYYYVVSAAVGGSETGNGPEATVGFSKLEGDIIGTSGSWGGSGATIDKVFDTDLDTFFDAPDGNGAWVGLDFGDGSACSITQIKYCPRATFESRMVGGIFQGANQPDFSDAVTLGTVSAQPATGVFTSVGIANASAFRYVRFLSPDGGFGNVAELEFYGYPLGTVSIPQVELTMDGTNLTFSWPQESAGFTVQACTNLVSGIWDDVVSPVPQLVGTNWQVTLPPTSDEQVFYRLVK